MAKLAIILNEGPATRQQLRLGRILEFFGVPCKSIEISKLSEVNEDAQEQVVFGSIQAVAAALKRANCTMAGPAAFYIYLGNDWRGSERHLRSLFEGSDISIREAPAGIVSLRVSNEAADLAGPMAGLEVSARLRKEDAVLYAGVDSSSRFATVITAGKASTFVRFHYNGVPVFFCASGYMVDIDQEVGAGFYDVKEDFCSVVPLVMLIKLMFPHVAWRPQELGACLIVDDPLLQQRYGSCDFGKLSILMRRYEFTTNIAFIPWNWRRTSPSASNFFRNESERFSVSIHGCDHIESEFGTTSFEILNAKARLAQARMRNHEVRTGIHHDPVMVFPQGVFSSVCPEVLKRNGFLAAVNTETVPVDSQGARTRVRDVWDIAVLAFSSFPIFTRRYAFHGLENFAFDLLLGKPCLIVSHHGFFKDSGAAVIELIQKLHSLNCSLRWRPLGDVIRRACRLRFTRVGVEDVEMYGNELVIDNPSNHVIKVRVRKNETQTDLVAAILRDGKPITWANEAGYLVFGETIEPHSQCRFHVHYLQEANIGMVDRSLRFEFSVAVRRILCELRDDYVSRSKFLSMASTGLKEVLTKVN